MQDNKQTSASGWILLLDAQTGKKFFHNKITNQTLWTLPDELRKTVEGGLESDWWELFDNDRKLPYYYNNKTKVTLWKRPENCSPIKVVNTLRRKDNQVSLPLSSSGEQQTKATQQNGISARDELKTSGKAVQLLEQAELSQPALKPNWRKIYDHNSKRYYYGNIITKETTWDPAKAILQRSADKALDEIQDIMKTVTGILDDSQEDGRKRAITSPVNLQSNREKIKESNKSEDGISLIDNVILTLENENEEGDQQTNTNLPESSSTNKNNDKKSKKNENKKNKKKEKYKKNNLSPRSRAQTTPTTPSPYLPPLPEEAMLDDFLRDLGLVETMKNKKNQIIPKKQINNNNNNNNHNNNNHNHNNNHNECKLDDGGVSTPPLPSTEKDFEAIPEPLNLREFVILKEEQKISQHIPDNINATAPSTNDSSNLTTDNSITSKQNNVDPRKAVNRLPSELRMARSDDGVFPTKSAEPKLDKGSIISNSCPSLASLDGDIAAKVRGMPKQNYNRSESTYLTKSFGLHLSSSPVANLRSEAEAEKKPHRRFSFRKLGKKKKKKAPVGMVAEEPEDPQDDTATKTLSADFKNEINKFQLEGYAKHYFSTRKKGIFRRKLPLKELLTFQVKPLAQPLLKAPTSEASKAATYIFKQILAYQGLRDLKEDPDTPSIDLVREIIAAAIKDGQLRDEIYCQLCKQTCVPVHSASTEFVPEHLFCSEVSFKGWELMCVCTVTFPPTRDLEAWLRAYINEYTKLTTGKEHKYANYCVKKLDIICKEGPRGRVPSTKEIKLIFEAPFACSPFGATLEEIMEYQSSQSINMRLPFILVALCDSIIKFGGEQFEGIFRIPSEMEPLYELKAELERGNFTALKSDTISCTTVASLLRLWMRELKYPIIPHELYAECIDISSGGSAEIIKELPELNCRVVMYLVRFLRNMAREEVQVHTKMSVSNLAMIFAPNFLRNPSDSKEEIIQNAKKEQDFVKDLMLHLEIPEEEEETEEEKKEKEKMVKGGKDDESDEEKEKKGKKEKDEDGYGSSSSSDGSYPVGPGFDVFSFRSSSDFDSDSDSDSDDCYGIESSSYSDD